MPAQQNSYLQEIADAARGCFMLLKGDRQAATMFDFSQRGLIGSFIAFLGASALMAFAPQLSGMQTEPGLATRALILGVALFAVQLGFAAIVLRQIKRMDGFLPYLVADNWVTFFVSLASSVLVFTGMSGDVTLFAVGIIVIILEINIARLIVTLSPLQIAMFIIAQLVGASVGLLLLASLLPIPAGVPVPV